MRLPLFPGTVMQEVDGYELGGPVSTLRALISRSMVQNAINWQPQVRVNFVSRAIKTVDEVLILDAFAISAAGALRRVWHQEFEHTWMAADKPVGLDIRVMTTQLSGAGTMTVEVKIVPANGIVDDTGVTAIWSDTDTVVGVGSLVIEGQWIPTGPVSSAGMTRDYSTQDDGAIRAFRTGLLRIEVAISVGAAHVGALGAVYVREFPCHP